MFRGLVFLTTDGHAFRCGSAKTVGMYVAAVCCCTSTAVSHLSIDGFALRFDHVMRSCVALPPLISLDVENPRARYDEKVGLT